MQAEARATLLEGAYLTREDFAPLRSRLAADRGLMVSKRYNAGVRDPKLTDAELAVGLQTLPDWKLENAKLHRQYKFSDFAQAIGFMMTAAPKIEKLDHHPEWANVYNKVTVDLTTHDSGGVTKRDMELAEVLEGIAKKLL